MAKVKIVLHTIADMNVSYIIILPMKTYFRLAVSAKCPIRFNGLPVSDERCGQFG